MLQHRNLPGAFGASRDDGKTWGLYRKEDGEDVEMQFVVQGAVSAINLPPFAHLPRCVTKTLLMVCMLISYLLIPSNRAHILQQSIQVTGLDSGDGLFSDGLRTIREAQLVFSRTVSGLGEWQPGECNQHRKSAALDVGNRIFEAKTSTQTEVPFHIDVDPKGMLSAIGRQAGLRHTVDNAVIYLRRSTFGNKFK